MAHDETGRYRGRIVLVRLENGKEEILTKYIYLRMINAGRKIKLLKEGKHWDDLR